ncbi:MAG: biliverdin-producing heme oxygenase [Pseudomonadota bacterium]
MDAVADITTRHGYVRMLRIMRTVYAQLSAVLESAACTLGITPRYDALLRAIDADLKALGCIVDVSESRDNEDWSTSEALGATYVMEGSALGSQLLRKRLLERHTETLPHTYFDTIIAAQPTRWRQVVAALNHSEARRDDMLAGALATFAALDAAACSYRTTELCGVDSNA